MKWKVTTVLVIGAASFAAIGAWAFGGADWSNLMRWAGFQVGPPKLTANVISRLEQLAEDACICEQNGKHDCRAQYDEALKGYAVESYASACSPISASSDRISYRGEEAWVVTSYGVVGNVPKGVNRHICLKRNAEAVEQAYIRGFGPNLDWDKPGSEKALRAKEKAANDALAEALRKLARGETLAHADNSKGCT